MASQLFLVFLSSIVALNACRPRCVSCTASASHRLLRAFVLRFEPQMGPFSNFRTWGLRGLLQAQVLLLLAEFPSVSNAQTFYNMPSSLPPNPVPAGSNLNLYWYYK